jgi:glycosyltransferase involved in cell wall biosynthesis
MYAHADLFVTPSLMEGFGWTPLEAAILKVPVLTSNIDVMREVACGKLETFDPYSPEDLAAHMERILNNPPDEQTRQELADFFLEKYSLKAQIDGLTNVLLKSLD